MKPMSKTFYLWSFVACMVVSMITAAVCLELFKILSTLDEARTYVVVGLLMMVVFLLVVQFYFLIVFYNIDL